MYKEISRCRICGNSNLDTIIHLGNQSLTGVFPKSKNEKITIGPLELVRCAETGAGDVCGLVQLRHSYDQKEMYGMNYGYRSGLNRSMVEHLHDKVNRILGKVPLLEGDLILDIGSNDGTLLSSYPAEKNFDLIGMDPTGIKFKEYYPQHVQLFSDFFSAEAFKRIFGQRKAKVVTSIAMFYDLEIPLDFMQQVAEILDEKGVWLFEQSYMPTMLAENSYDTICHEHLEYYALKQIKWMTDHAGLKIIDVEFNKINGGSFSLMVARADSPFHEDVDKVNLILGNEKAAGLDTMEPYKHFKDAVFRHRDELCLHLKEIHARSERVFGYGASTKGNVILQWCGLTEKDISCIAEVNQEKFGALTPGTHIPIISEKEARAMKPEYFLVLPWHFRENIILREQDYLRAGGKLFFPLPKLEIIS